MPGCARMHWHIATHIKDSSKSSKPREEAHRCCDARVKELDQAAAAHAGVRPHAQHLAVLVAQPQLHLPVADGVCDVEQADNCCAPHPQASGSCYCLY